MITLQKRPFIFRIIILFLAPGAFSIAAKIQVFKIFLWPLNDALINNNHLLWTRMIFFMNLFQSFPGYMGINLSG